MLSSSRWVLVLPVLLGCRAEPGDPRKDTVGTIDTSNTPDTVDTVGTEDTEDTVDTGDSPVDTDETAETGDPTDSETGGGDTEVDSEDTAREGLDLEADADAKLVGESAGDACGEPRFPLAAAGDVDGDGLQDLLFGLPCDGRGGSPNAGAAFLVSGSPIGTRSLATADAILVGTGHDLAGWAVAGAGDVNADGYDDLLVGAPEYGGDGAAYVFFGPVTGTLALTDADAVLLGDTTSGGVGCSPIHTGYSVAGIGDTNGDGFADVLLTAQGCRDAYLLRGPFEGDVDLVESTDARLSGKVATTADTPTMTHPAGDLDGDGMDDILISVNTASTDYALIFDGGASGDVAPADAEAELTDSILGYGAAKSPRAGMDINGDGLDDLLVGSITDTDGGDYAGAAHLLLGPIVGMCDLSASDAKAVGMSERLNTGYDLAALGDVDGDSFGDVAIGAPALYGSGGPGHVHILFGPISGTFSLADADVQFDGEGDDQIGSSLAGVGDVDGDGIPDLLVGGSGDDDGGADAAAAWLVAGTTLLGR